MAKSKQQFGIDEAFMSEVGGMDIAAKKAFMARLEAYKQDTQTFLKENPDIVSVRDTLQEMTGPSKDTIKSINNRLKYIVAELKKVGEFQQAGVASMSEALAAAAKDSLKV